MQRWSDIVEDYDNYRPAAPDDIITVIKRLAQNEHPGFVVDLGSGTGGSARAWAGHAREVIGVEPSLEMLNIARERTKSETINYVNRYGNDTGLKDSVADIVCASSSIHWMEPESTIKEVLRILKNGGLFSFFGPSHPPVSPFLEVDQQYFDFVDQIQHFHTGLPESDKWDWKAYIGHIDENKLFAYRRYFYINQEMDWGAGDYINWLKTTNGIHLLLKRQNVDFIQLFNDFRRKIEYHFGTCRQKCFFVYRIYVFR